MTEGEELAALVRRAQAREIEAYGRLVRRFQDMAVGYAASLLGDFHLAEGAVQEAFLEAWRDLPRLREPAAFPAWLRRIGFKQCDRLTRRKRPTTVPIEAATEVASTGLHLMGGVCQQCRTYSGEGVRGPGMYIASPLFARVKMMAGIPAELGAKQGQILYKTREGKEHDLPVSVHPSLYGETMVIRTRRE
jgi:hypothetical protein